MAAIVLANKTGGAGSITWSNNTGENVRVIINYFGVGDAEDSTSRGISLSTSINFNINNLIQAPYAVAIGKNLGSNNVYAPSVGSNNLVNAKNFSNYQSAIPVEFFLPAGYTFSLSRITGTASFQYNIVIIPENG